MKHLITFFAVSLLASLHPLHAVTPHKTKRCEVDYIVVGGGTAGSVVGRMLSDNFCNSVLLLERGPNHMNNPQVVTCDTSRIDDLLLNPTFTTSTVVADTFGQNRLVANGTMLGGSAAHNFLLYVWSEQPLDKWAAFSGNPRWARNATLPLLKANEHFTPFTPPASPLRGTEGPLEITQNPPISSLAIAQNAATILGAPLTNDYNVTDLGTSTFQNFCAPVNGVPERTFSARAYLNSIIHPDGTSKGHRKLRVKVQARATRILFGGKDGKKAIGVEYVINGNREKVRRVYARKEIIVSAGSFYTPQLLLLSGIGPKQQLDTFSIPVVQANEHVGAHFKYHYGVAGIFSGGYAEPLPIVSFFNAAIPQTASRDSQLIFFPFVLGGTPGISLCVGTLGGTIDPTARFGSMFAWNLLTRSEGTIELADTNPFTEPLIRLNSYSDGDLTDPNSDASKSVSYFKRMRQIAQSIGQEMVFPTPASYASDEKLFEAALISPSITNHYLSTCRMSKVATGPQGGVVDGELRVHGIRNLRIADLSVTPSDLGFTGNTGVPANLIGIVAAQLLGATTIP